MKAAKHNNPISQRGEVLVDHDTVVTFVAQDTNTGRHLQRQTARRITPDMQAASATVEAMTDHLAAVQKRMLAEMDALAAAAKDASRKARTSATDMSALLDKFNRSTDYVRLERNVAIIERMAAALGTLAELEKSGHLSKLMKGFQQ